jgi:hypothetical protein
MTNKITAKTSKLKNDIIMRVKQVIPAIYFEILGYQIRFLNRALYNVENAI